MARNYVEGDQHVAGRITCENITLPDDTVGEDQIPSDANIAAERFEQQYAATVADTDGTTSSSKSTVITQAQGTSGEFVALRVSCDGAPVGAATHTVDVHIEGTGSVLTGVVTLDSGSAADTVYDGTFDGTALAQDDIVKIVEVATAGGGTLPTGVAVTLHWREEAD